MQVQSFANSGDLVVVACKQKPDEILPNSEPASKYDECYNLFATVY